MPLSYSPDAPLLRHVSIAGLPRMNRPMRRQSLSAEPQSGFTLLELLVVLVLLGIIAVLVAPGLGGSLDNAKLKTASRELLAVLRVQRSVAITQGKIITLSFTRDEPSYRIDDERVVLGAGLSVVYQAATGTTSDGGLGQQLPDGGNNHLVFYPDGSSSGAMLQLRMGEGLRYLRVDWLTGAVSLYDSFESPAFAELESP
ncbi:MAG: type II secretion system protein GspH [Cellvibrionales bacterium]|nr:MAG: type II secretion system protein GspH [Cellvibrionales bacterium]